MAKSENEKNMHSEHHKHQDQKHVHKHEGNHEDHDHHKHEGHGHTHEEHGHHGHHDHGDMVEDFKKRFFISLIITIPILALSPMLQGWIGVDWRFTGDRKSTRLNSSHVAISYAVFCLKKKKIDNE